ncbi:MAG: hypothetical protein ABIQ22_03405, partial [Arthrobacter oryzae]
SVAARIPPGSGVDIGARGAGASGAPARPSGVRIGSAAGFLGGRAVARNHRMILRWRLALGARTAPAGLRPC